MNIIKTKDQDGIEELVIKIPLKQISYDAIGDVRGESDTVIGIIAGDSYSLSQLIDLGYKDDQQEGMPIIMFDTREELEETCRNLNIGLWEHPNCAYCKEVIRGSFTLGDKGNMCWNCNETLTKEKEGVS